MAWSRWSIRCPCWCPTASCSTRRRWRAACTRRTSTPGRASGTRCRRETLQAEASRAGRGGTGGTGARPAGPAPRLVVAAQSDILRAIGNAHRALAAVGAQVEQFEARDALRSQNSRIDPAQVDDDAPVVRVVQLIITQALRDRASDVHIEPH